MTARGEGKATKRIVDLFQHYYEDRYGTVYRVNYPMIKSAEKVAQYYTVNQIDQALNFYFKIYSKHDMWSFINELDVIYQRSEKEQELLDHLEDLKEQTRERLERLGGQ